jgi:hypothetical protein
MVVLVTGLAAAVTWFVTDRDAGSGAEQGELDGPVTVPDIADRLAQAGLGCEAVLRNEPPEPGDENELGTLESAICGVGDAPNLEGPSVHAVIIVYDSDEHLRVDNPSAPPGHAVISGERWEVYVPAREPARAIAEELGGDLELPDEFFDPSARPTG